MKCLLCVLLALPLCAQLTFQPSYPQVRKYLQLTDAQERGIALNNTEYDQQSLSKSERIAQVRTEIAEETQKDPLDPAALGVRYAEIELIRRDLAELADARQKQHLALLTDAQRVKLKALEEAIKLFPIACEAAVANLLTIGSDSGCPSVIFGRFSPYLPITLTPILR